MKTIGEILKSARVSRKLTLTDLSRLTKIPLITLKALEKKISLLNFPRLLTFRVLLKTMLRLFSLIQPKL